MGILNLKDGFAPLGGGTLYLSRGRVFSGGELDVLVGGEVPREVTITTRLNSSEDLMQALMATDAVRSLGAEKVHLFAPYLPYARQDRVMEPGEAFSLRVFADIVNAQHYASVTVFDAHSDVGPALIRNAVNLKNHAFIKQVLETQEDYVIVSPDAGAFKKIHQTCAAIGYAATPVICTKVRASMGEIEHISISASNFEGKNVFIIDDICDGGRTFIALASEIRKRNAGTINLIVSHGIFSYGEAPLREGGVDHVYTTDSVKQFESSFVTQLRLRDILSR